MGRLKSSPPRREGRVRGTLSPRRERVCEGLFA